MTEWEDRVVSWETRRESENYWLQVEVQGLRRSQEFYKSRVLEAEKRRAKGRTHAHALWLARYRAVSAMLEALSALELEALSALEGAQ